METSFDTFGPLMVEQLREQVSNLLAAVHQMCIRDSLPTGTASRAEAAVILMRFCEIFVK